MIIHSFRRRLPVLIDAHVSIWARKLGDIEEDVFPISIRMTGMLLSISRGIGRKIVPMKSLAVSTITCGCGGLKKLVGVKWDFERIPF